MSNKQHIRFLDDPSIGDSKAKNNDRRTPVLPAGEVLELLEIVDDLHERAQHFTPDPQHLFTCFTWGEREGYHRIPTIHVRLNFLTQLLRDNLDILVRVDDPGQPVNYLSRRVLLLETFMDQNLVLQRLRLSGLTALEVGRHMWFSDRLSEDQLSNIIISSQSTL